MITVDVSTLNALERKIHETMLTQRTNSESQRITQAAEICQCSVSKIAKFVKKLGFRNYKQYIDFLSGKDIRHIESTNELQRIREFIDTFDSTLVDDLFSLIENHSKLILFGYGPSLLCAQYFEYRFRNCSDKTTMAVSDEIAVYNMVDESTLVIILTETGRFHSFQDVYDVAKEKGSDVVIIAEEYNTELFTQCDRIFWLSQLPQPSHFKAYEKSRTLFFIFLEEIIQRLLVHKER